MTHAIGQINIDEEDLSDDDYDFLDDNDGSRNRQRNNNNASKEPMYKYADMLQKLADRALDEVLIELDDVASVRRYTVVGFAQVFIRTDALSSLRQTRTEL